MPRIWKKGVILVRPVGNASSHSITKIKQNLASTTYIYYIRQFSQGALYFITSQKSFIKHRLETKIKGDNVLGKESK